MDDCFDLAAQTAFYFVLSLFPFCLVLAVIVGSLPSSSLWATFATWIVKYLPSDSQDLVLVTILRLGRYSPGFLSFGLLATIWSASAGFVSLMESLSVAYGGRDRRSYLMKHTIGATFTLLAAIFALGTFGLMAFGHWELPRLLLKVTTWSISRAISELGRWLATIAALYLAIDLIYFILPTAKRRWRWLSPGATFVVVTLVAVSIGFDLYFHYFPSYPRIYGTLGGFIILMLWVYLASVIVLVGAEANCELEKWTMETGSR